MKLRENSGAFGAFRALFSVGSLAAFLFAITLAAAPGVHEHLHADASQAQHECAVTILGSGKFQLADSAPVAAAPAAAVPASTVAPLHPVWVPPVFLRACIFEHAPPALS
jgi:hypothetical protein